MLWTASAIGIVMCQIAVLLWSGVSLLVAIKRSSGYG